MRLAVLIALAFFLGAGMVWGACTPERPCGVLAVDYASLSLGVVGRIELVQAEFAWSLAGDDSAVSQFLLQCVSGRGTTVAAFADRLARTMPVIDLIQSNGIYSCWLSAVDSGNRAVAESNEVMFEVKGKWLTVLP